MKDLVVLVADKDTEYALKGILGRSASLRIRADLQWDVFVHPRRDPGCLNEAHSFLQPYASAYRYAMVIFDHEGCGRDQEPATEIANEVRQRLEIHGWAGRAEAIVIAPELEVWVWTHSPHVAACLGWGAARPALRDWLQQQGHWPGECAKPPHPKEAMAAVLHEVRKPRSSAIYLALAEKVSLVGHQEPAFLRLAQALQRWFAGA